MKAFAWVNLAALILGHAAGGTLLAAPADSTRTTNAGVPVKSTSLPQGEQITAQPVTQWLLLGPVRDPATPPNPASEPRAGDPVPLAGGRVLIWESFEGDDIFNHFRQKNRRSASAAPPPERPPLADRRSAGAR